MKFVWQLVHLTGLALLVCTLISCGDVVRQGPSPMMLLVDSIGGASGSSSSSGGSSSGGSSSSGGGSSSGAITNPARSDVVADDNRTVVNDSGSATLRSIRKDVTNPTVPTTTNNDITIRRVHVSYRRSDGKNTPGVDVPYPFDNAVSVTIPAEGSAPVTFDLVRQDAKLESPLIDLRTKPIVLTVIADVTFYGTDAVGNEIAVVGSVTINFANFGGA
jgi:hypothetical protein